MGYIQVNERDIFLLLSFSNVVTFSPQESFSTSSLEDLNGVNQ